MISTYESPAPVAHSTLEGEGNVAIEVKRKSAEFDMYKAKVTKNFFHVPAA